MGKASRDKGNRNELLAAAVLPGAEKVSRMYQTGADVRWHGWLVEVKVRADGFRMLYRWLAGKAGQIAPDFLMVKADRKQWLVVMEVGVLLELMEEARLEGAEPL